LRALLEGAKDQDRDIWARWNAVRYIDTTFSGRFDRERLAIQRLEHLFTAADADRLWVTGELVAALRWRLRNTVGLCHHGAEFAGLGSTLLRAVGCWFAAVEGIVGPLTWDDVSAQVRDALTFLGTEKTPAWRGLPGSLVTSL
jgi:hypothetical protein